MAALVAIQATSADLRGRRVLERKDFRFVPTAVDVLLAGAMARFATMPLGTFMSVELRVHGRGNVRGGRKIGVNVLVAGLTSFRAHVERGIRRPHIRFRLRSLCFVRSRVLVLGSPGGQQRY